MSTFTDDFNRPDGGLGNNWVSTGSAGITGGRMWCQSSNAVSQSGVNASGRQEAQVVYTVSLIADLANSVVIKLSTSGFSGYAVSASGTLANPVWSIRKHSTFYATTTLISVGGGGLSAGDHLVRFLYFNGLLSLWVDGYFISTVADSQYGANTCAGVIASNQAAVFNSFTLLGDEAVGLTVSPSPIGNFGQPTAITLTGVASAWTPGTPGSPTFTVDHGALSNQIVTSGTTATATYNPLTFLGIATFADPSTGATCQVNVSSDVSVIPPPGAGLSSTAIEYIERSALDGTDPIITNRQGLIEQKGAYVDIQTILADIHLGAYDNTSTVGSEPTNAKLLYALYGLISGYHPPRDGVFTASSDTTLKEDLDFLRDRWEDSGHVSPWTLEQAITALAGDPLASHQSILTAISAIPTGDNQDVLDAIAAMQGDPLATIKAVLDRVYLLDPTATHNLAEILTAISAIDPGSVDLSPVLTAISNLQTYLHGEHETIRTELAAGFLVVTAIQALLGSASGTVANVIAGVTDVLDGINDIKASLSAPVTPPIWIDEAHATVGASVPLTNGLTITGPLDGTIVTIDTAPSGAGKFAFGDVRSWRYVGAVIFQSDRGDWEWAQPIGLTDQLITPRTMQHASAARFRLESGWQGTVRAFTVTAGS